MTDKEYREERMRIKAQAAALREETFELQQQIVRNEKIIAKLDWRLTELYNKYVNELEEEMEVAL